MKKHLAKWLPASALGVAMFASTAHAGFQVQGGKLVEGNGSPFVMRGVSHAHIWFTGTTQQALRDIASTGANTVRFVISDGHHSGSRTSGADLSQMIQWSKESKLIAVLEVHDATGFGDDASAEDPLAVTNYWLSSDVRQAINGQEDYVIINSANEPIGNNKAADWTNMQKQTLQRLRDGGINHTIMVDAPNWGQDWSNTMRNNAQQVFDADKNRNTVFSVHMYESYGNANTVQSYYQDFKNKNLPLVVGEFGADHKGAAVDEDAIMAGAQQHGFGYLGWSWSGNNAETKSLDIANSFNVNSLSSWGNRLINGSNGIKQTSKLATIYCTGCNASSKASTQSSSQDPLNLAFNKPATASTTEGAGFEASKAVDGNSTTRWASNLTATTADLTTDLGGFYNITGMKLSWEAAYAKSYTIQISSDNVNWSDIASKTNSIGGVENISLTGQGRYIRLYMATKANAAWGYSLWSMEVYGSPFNPTSSVAPSSISSSSIASNMSLSSKAIVSSSSASSKATFNRLGCTMKQTGSWQGGGQFDGTITNNSTSVSSWVIYLNFSQAVQGLSVWNANVTQISTSKYKLTNTSWNGNLGGGASTGFGMTANFTGSVTASCSDNDGTIASSTPSSTPKSSSSVPSSTPISSSPVLSSTPKSSSSVQSSVSITRVDNPFVGAVWYVDPIWSAKAMAEPNGSKVAKYSTAVWMDRIGAIAPTESGSMGLREHLNAALAQQANLIQVVIYDLPNRDCHALASNGELKIEENGFNRYKNEYIAPIVSILSDPKYNGLRIIAIIEPDSLPNLATNLGDVRCAASNGKDGYVEANQHTLNALYPLTNVYSYVDIGHSGWLGWDDNMTKATNIIANAIKGTTNGVNSVAGFISNTANTTPLKEPFLDALANSSINGAQVKSASFYEFNPLFSELSFVQAWRNKMIGLGFPSTIGMLVDTSRNGWGGAGRPTAVSNSTDLNTFVNASKIDRRTHRGMWCNQSSGIGERPTIAPEAGVDAYVWIKPPGESDGVATAGIIDPTDPSKGFDGFCDPTFKVNGIATGAMAGAPHAGRWFSEGFKVLINNAYPPVQ